jgi:hypothetical protein
MTYRTALRRVVTVAAALTLGVGIGIIEFASRTSPPATPPISS